MTSRTYGVFRGQDHFSAWDRLCWSSQAHSNLPGLGDLEDAAAKAISFATGCPEEPLKTRMRQYHKAQGFEPETPLRADPFGKNTTQGLGKDPIWNSRSGGRGN